MKNLRVLGLVLLSSGLTFGLAGCAETELASHVIKQVPAQNTGKSQGKFKVGSPYKSKDKNITLQKCMNMSKQV